MEGEGGRDWVHASSGSLGKKAFSYDALHCVNFGWLKLAKYKEVDVEGCRCFLTYLSQYQPLPRERISSSF